jgi:hypothetical protein
MTPDDRHQQAGRSFGIVITVARGVVMGDRKVGSSKD